LVSSSSLDDGGDPEVMVDALQAAYDLVDAVAGELAGLAAVRRLPLLGADKEARHTGAGLLCLRQRPCASRLSAVAVLSAKAEGSHCRRSDCPENCNRKSDLRLHRMVDGA